MTLSSDLNIVSFVDWCLIKGGMQHPPDKTADTVDFLLITEVISRDSVILVLVTDNAWLGIFEDKYETLRLDTTGI